MVKVGDIALTSLDTITCFDVTSGAYLFTLDELHNANISQSEEKVDITGKQGRKITSLKRNKAVTISGDNGLVSAGLWELQTGSSFAQSNTATVEWVDYLTVASTGNKAITSYIAIGTAGSEIEGCFVKDSSGLLSTELTQVASSISSGKFTYTPNTKTLQFHTDMAAGTEIVVFYKRRIQADVLKNESDKYAGKCKMYIDATGEDKCANVYHVQIYVPKADFSGEWSFDMGDNQTIHSFNAEALAGGCGDGSSFFTYSVFAGDTKDRDASGAIVS